MKATKTLFIIFFAVIAGSLAITTSAIAEPTPVDSNPISHNILAGAGAGYATGIKSLGIFAKGVYQFTEAWEAAPQLVYYLEQDNITWFDVYLNANYVFYSLESMRFYGSAGLTLTRASYNYPKEMQEWVGASSVSNTETNLNLGAGMYYNLTSSLLLNADVKYTIGSADHLFIGAGIMFKF